MARKTPRPNVVAVRLTDEEMAAVRAGADLYGQSLSEWTRSAMRVRAQRFTQITVNGVSIPAHEWT